MSEPAVNFRTEALGAFSHEFRTPLTAIKMVMELGRRAGSEGSIHLEAEIAGMLEESMTNLEDLADGIQALSWLERGKLKLDSRPSDLAVAVERAVSLAGDDVPVTTRGAEGISGPWDADRLPDCLAAVIDAAARCGEGAVTLVASESPGVARVEVTSGKPGENPRPINADLGFRFFAACTTLEYSGAGIRCDRASRYVHVTIDLPR